MLKRFAGSLLTQERGNNQATAVLSALTNNVIINKWWTYVSNSSKISQKLRLTSYWPIQIGVCKKTDKVNVSCGQLVDAKCSEIRRQKEGLLRVGLIRALNSWVSSLARARVASPQP